jgi:hypothetical protein
MAMTEVCPIFLYSNCIGRLDWNQMIQNTQLDRRLLQILQTIRMGQHCHFHFETVYKI